MRQNYSRPLNARRIAQGVQADKYAAQSFIVLRAYMNIWSAWAVREKKLSKKLLQAANTVTASYEDARALAMRQQFP